MSDIIRQCRSSGENKYVLYIQHVKTVWVCLLIRQADRFRFSLKSSLRSVLQLSCFLWLSFQFCPTISWSTYISHMSLSYIRQLFPQTVYNLLFSSNENRLQRAISLQIVPMHLSSLQSLLSFITFESNMVSETIRCLGGLQNCIFFWFCFHE